MVSALLVVPFQKGPYGEGGREMRGFLLFLLEAAVVVCLVLLLIFVPLSFISFSNFTQHKSKQNKILGKYKREREEKEAWLLL